jgi:phenylalanyl-tRNA synthetase alpha chain
VSALDRIAELQSEATAAVAASADLDALEQTRLRYLGRKSELPMLLRSIGSLDPSERTVVGSAANTARTTIEALISAREDELAGGELSAALDITLPGAPPLPNGHLHLITETRRDIEDVFLGLGFEIAEGPEIELAEYNFDALNTDLTHPSRARSTVSSSM